MNKPKQTEKPERKKLGAPSKAPLEDPNVVALLCDRLASGMSIRDIGKMDDMPSTAAIFVRMAKDEDFKNAIARAREAQQDAEVEACVAMADAATPEDYQVVKLRIWARQWRAAKLAPKKYGDKIDINANVTHVLSSLTDEELATEIEKAKAGQP